jgi:F-type H+-transporting ATPase subunit alpha
MAQVLRQQVGTFSTAVHFQDVGTVQYIGNGVATLSGLQLVRTEELVVFPTGVQGMVLNLDRDRVDVILLGSDAGIQGGDLVRATGQRLRIPAGPGLVGRILDPLGLPLDGQGPVEALAHVYIERRPPTIVERAPVREPLYTGLKVMDVLLPLGRGQRELIAGNRQTGKTSLAVDAILSQRSSGVLCVYVAIGQKRSSTLAVVETIQQEGALEHTIVVLSSPDDPPALRYLAPYAGCSMAEYLVHQLGRDVLIVYDDLSKHADSYRELSLLLRRPPGREAYPGDIFYVHSRLLERACKLNDDAGGSSLTALPVVELQRGNVSAYIPTNLISITDGQIVLDSDLFNQNVKPAVNVGRSVSRVGSSAQVPAMRALAGDLKLQLAQYEEVARFARLGTDVDEATRRQLDRGQRLQALFTQPVHAPLAPAEQIVVMFAAGQGLSDPVPTEELPSFERALLSDWHEHHSELLDRIGHDQALTEEIRSLIAEEISRFVQSWLEGERR